LAASRVSNVEAFWHAQDINGKPENELSTVALKNEITYIFYWFHLIF
jgi:hypothetical protein